MSGWLRIVLAAQLAFFALWGGRLVASHRDGDVVWLATEPVDPRDLLGGNYVALRYPIGAPSVAGCATLVAEQPAVVYVQLAPATNPTQTADGPIALSEAINCQLVPPSPAADERWIAGNVVPSRPGQIRYGIERFYVGETNPLREARSGTVVAKVRINRELEPRVLDLVRLPASAR